MSGGVGPERDAVLASALATLSKRGVNLEAVITPDDVIASLLAELEAAEKRETDAGIRAEAATYRENEAIVRATAAESRLEAAEKERDQAKDRWEAWRQQAVGEAKRAEAAEKALREIADLTEPQTLADLTVLPSFRQLNRIARDALAGSPTQPE